MKENDNVELEEIGKVLVEAERGCWHEDYGPACNGEGYCRKCNKLACNPDFSKWENFGRLLKIAYKNRFDVLSFAADAYTHKFNIIDKIPLLVAQKLARIIKEK